jgi:hypothetical protein
VALGDPVRRVVDERDAPVAEGREVRHGVAQGGLEVDVHRGERAVVRGPAYERDGDPRRPQPADPHVVEVHLHDEHPVREPLAGHLDDPGLVGHAERPQHELVAPLLRDLGGAEHELGGRAAQAGGADRVGQGQHAAAARREPARQGVAGVAELVHRGDDAGAGGRGDGAGGREGGRDGGEGDAGAAGDVLHGDDHGSCPPR